MRIQKNAVLIFLFLWIIQACSPEPTEQAETTSQEPASGGVIVLGAITDVDSWNEYLTNQAYSTYVLQRIFPPLASPIGDEFKPELAESWELSADRLRLTVQLREANWSDGKPLTADDVAFTFVAQTNPEVAWSNVENKSQIESVTALDGRTVLFQFKQVYPYQLSDAFEGGILPKHVFGEVPFESWATHDWSQVRIGAGPFILDRHEIGSTITLVKNDEYYREGLPYVDRVMIRIVPNMESLVLQLQSGEIDFYHDLQPADAERIAANAQTALETVEYDIPRYDYIGWNQRRPPLDQREVRLALTLGIDREDIVDSLLLGFGSLASRPVYSKSWGALDSLQPHEYNPERARELMRKYGFSEANRLKLGAMTNGSNRLRSDVLVKIQSQLEQIYVDLEVQLLEQATLRRLVAEGDFDAYLGGWNLRGRVPLIALFGSDSGFPAGVNFVAYQSEALDSELAALAQAENREAQLEPLHNIQRIIHEDQPYTFLYERSGIVVHSDQIKGVVIQSKVDPLANLEQFWVSPN